MCAIAAPAVTSAPSAGGRVGAYSLSDELAVMMCGIDQSVRPSTLARKHEKPKRGAKQAMPKTRRPLVIDKGRNRQIQAKPNGQKL
jgi:hypothetical protein